MFFFFKQIVPAKKIQEIFHEKKRKQKKDKKNMKRKKRKQA